MAGFIGINRETGEVLTGLRHLRQSIADIVRTQAGTCVRRRDYAGDVPDLIDTPMNRPALLCKFALIAKALREWEPRFRLTKITPSDVTAGSLSLSLSGYVVANSEEIAVEVSL